MPPTWTNETRKDRTSWNEARHSLACTRSCMALTKDETQQDSGWWETDEGSHFGAERLRLLGALVIELTAEGQ